MKATTCMVARRGPGVIPGDDAVTGELTSFLWLLGAGRIRFPLNLIRAMFGGTSGFVDDFFRPVLDGSAGRFGALCDAFTGIFGRVLCIATGVLHVLPGGLREACDGEPKGKSQN